MISEHALCPAVGITIIQSEMQPKYVYFFEKRLFSH